MGLSELRQVAAEQHGLFTRADAMSCGFSPYQIRSRVRRGEWVAVFGAVLAPSGLPITARTRDIAAQLAIPGAVLSGPSAGRLHGMEPPDSRSCVTLPRDRHLRLRTLHVFREPLDRSDVTALNGMTVTSRARTVFDCLRLLSRDAAVTFLDRALLLGWTELSDLSRRVSSHTGRHGAPQLARLVGQASSGACSAAERLVIPLIRTAGLIGWRANYLVAEVGAVVDVGFPERRVAVEVDGWAYHHRPDQFQKDRRRQNRLVAAGWTVLRFTWRDLTERPSDVVDTIRMVVTSRAG